MKNDEFELLPYASIDELIKLRKYCLQILEKNSDVIYTEDIEAVLHQFRDITGKFVFNIRDVKFDKPKSLNFYKVYYKPASLVTIEGITMAKYFEEIKISLDKWIDNVRKMHAVTKEYYNPDAKFYDDEFIDFFINKDEDSVTSPFDIKRQEVLYYFLSFAETQINKTESINEDKKIELLKDIKSLKDNIPNLTKKRAVAALSKFAQKAKKFSNVLFHDIFDVLKKEAIKKVLFEGAEHIPNAIKNIEHWISLLQ